MRFFLVVEIPFFGRGSVQNDRVNRLRQTSQSVFNEQTVNVVVAVFVAAAFVVFSCSSHFVLFRAFLKLACLNRSMN